MSAYALSAYVCITSPFPFPSNSVTRALPHRAAPFPESTSSSVRAGLYLDPVLLLQDGSDARAGRELFSEAELPAKLHNPEHGDFRFSAPLVRGWGECVGGVE